MRQAKEEDDKLAEQIHKEIAGEEPLKETGDLASTAAKDILNKLSSVEKEPLG